MLLLYVDFFKIKIFTNFFRNTFRVSTSMDLDQAQPVFSRWPVNTRKKELTLSSSTEVLYPFNTFLIDEFFHLLWYNNALILGPLLYILALCPLGKCSCLFVICWFFSKSTFFEKFFQKYQQSVKQFGSRSGPTFCRVWSGSKLSAKVISRRH